MTNDRCREGHRCVDHPFGCYNHPHTCGCPKEATITRAELAELRAAHDDYRRAANMLMSTAHSQAEMLDKLRARLRELEEELHGTSRLVVKQGGLLRRVVDAIRGRPPEDGMWSVHDAPELAERVVTLLRKGMAAADTQRLADMKDWRDECSAQLRAWTIFPGERG